MGAARWAVTDRLLGWAGFRGDTPTFVVDPPPPGGVNGVRRDAAGRLEPMLSPVYWGGAASTGTMNPGQVFTPTQPKTGRRRLIGRDRELARILQALQEDRAHVVLYSERGRGKTSLANMVIESLRRSGAIVGRYTCDAETRYDDMIRGLARDLPASLMAAGAVGSHDTGCAAALPPGELHPRDMVHLPECLDCRSLVLVVDEFDRVTHDDTRTRMADTIKQLSDRSVPLQFLIVGVSDNLDQILGQHPSIARAVLGAHLPLFDDSEVTEMILRGGNETGVTFPAQVVGGIVMLARGMPHMAQLLGLRVTQEAIARGEQSIIDEDLLEAIERVLEDTGPQTLATYADLTNRGADAAMVQALHRIAAAQHDVWGRVAVTEAQDGGACVSGYAVPASCWGWIKAAQVLVPVMPGSDLWLFADRPVLYLALLLAVRDGRALPPQAVGFGS